MQLAPRPGTGPAGAVLALPVAPDEDGAGGRLLAPGTPADLTAECAAMLAHAEHTGRAGQVVSLPRPLGQPRRVLLAGIGPGDEAGWRAAGAGITRAAAAGKGPQSAVTIVLPDQLAPAGVRGLVEGLLLAAYRFRLGNDPPGKASPLRRLTLVGSDPDRYQQAVAQAQVVAELTGWARDLTNTPSLRKDPAWFARQVTRRAGPAVTVRVWDQAQLRQAGFGGLLAVGAGSVRPPRLLELRWRPRRPRGHVVLVGKGITFDTGGLSLKRGNAMLLMRKDMAGAAAVVAATVGAAELGLPVSVTTLAPLAENMPSGSALRPGDVVRHWGGRTSEVRNTDAEGRLVLADALAYAAARLRPDVVVDLATLTGANAVALGKRTAALYSDDDELAAQLLAAAGEAGEQAWRMPLVDDYRDGLRSDLADLNNAPDGPGSVMAALYLREFCTPARWAHLDMSAPAWAERDDAELSRGATGWGVRTLLRWLAAGSFR